VTPIKEERVQQWYSPRGGNGAAMWGVSVGRSEASSTPRASPHHRDASAPAYEEE
jgi:hypothetical protein